MKKAYLLLGTLLCCLLVWGQNKTITGKVTDEKGAPLSGVSVQVKGSNTGTSTGEDGSYTISVAPDARTLVFSFVDRERREVNIGAQTQISLSLLPNDRSLQEVVVVGYGTQRRTELTGNISTISGAKLRDQPVQSFDQALSGRAAGVNINIPNGVIGSAPVIRVRGVNSISLSSSPLIVIDGVPAFSGDFGGTSTSNNVLSDLNPADIESIEVLKDAASAAIYGSRASAGVVLITTKKGKGGRAKVAYDSWAGWTKAYNLIEVLNAQEFTNLKNEGLNNAGTPPNGTTRGFYLTNDAAGNPISTRWYDHIYRTGFSHNHNLSVSGANDNTNYYFSAGYTDQQGMFRNNDYNRISGRFTLNHKVSEWLNVGGTFSYAASQNQGLSTGSNGASFNTGGAARLGIVLAPNVAPYNNDGTYNLSGNNTIGLMNNKSALNFYNPVYLLNNNRFFSRNERILANVYGQINLLKGLSFKTLYGIDNLTVQNEDYRSALHGDGVQFAGAIQNTIQRPRRWNWQNVLNFNTSLANKHNISAIAGIEQQYTLTDRWGADRRISTDPQFNTFQGGFADIALPTLPFIPILSENFLQSYFGRVNYDFDKRYLFSFNIRRDGNSAFAQKWGTFYGGSAGWAISEEAFWKASSLANAISTLRLRGSFGEVGNYSGINDFPYQGFYASGLNGAFPAIWYTQVFNPNLTWEKSRKLDVGINLGFLNNRFTLDVAYYRNNISNMVLFEPAAPSRGIPAPVGIPSNSILSNVGSMVNKGVEISLGGTIIQGREFSWNSNFNITTLQNSITALSNNNADVLIATGGLEQVSMLRVGQSIGSFYVVQTEGVNPDNGQRIFVLRDGTRVQYNHAAPVASRWTKVSDGSVSRPASQAADGVLIGPALPKWFGGFDNTFRWKGLDLNVLLYFSGGNYVYNGSKAGLHDNRNWNNAKDALNRWTKPGDNAQWPRVVFNDNISNGSSFPISNNVEKGDFLKVRNIALGYTLPRSWTQRARISSVRIYVAALNALTFTKYSGFDPEIQSNTGAAVANEQVVNGAPSVDRNAAPLSRTFNVGINIGF
jgi:TonB-dependent starch-binding outer membrane protein SusC